MTDFHNYRSSHHFRGRMKRIHMPVIDTYSEQMRACQIRSEKIPLTQNWMNSTDSTSQLPLIRQEFVSTSGQPSRFNSIRRRSFSSSHANSTVAHQTNQRTINGMRIGQNSTDASFVSSNIRSDNPFSLEPVVEIQLDTKDTQVIASNLSNPAEEQQKLGTYISNASAVSPQTGQAAKNAVTLLNVDVTTRRPSSRSPQYGYSFSRRNSRRKSSLFEREQDPGPYQRKRSHPRLAGSKTIRGEEEKLLLALATLAINDITGDRGPSRGNSRRNSTSLSRHYEQSIAALAPFVNSTEFCDSGQSSRAFNQPGFQTVLDALQRQNAYKEQTASAERSDSSDDDESDRTVESDRARVNKLRDYLKVSGCGEPLVITTVAEESQEDRINFAKLLKRMRRGENPRQRERLRRKAKLDYEMSIMKAESFCEQQDQVYMRTASADMKNRDIDFLEDELRYQALQEIKASQMREKQFGERAFQNRRRSSTLQGQINKKLRTVKRQRDQTGKLEEVDGADNENIKEWVMDDIDGCEEEEQGGDIVTTGHDLEDDLGEGESYGDRDDVLSGLLSSPFTKQEMRTRILAWVEDVEYAMATAKTKKDHVKEK